MIVEGSEVVYVGEDTMVGVGAQGLVLSSSGGISGDYCHLRWVTGGKTGSTDLIPSDDLVPSQKASRKKASPRQGDLTEAVDSYAALGVTAAINALSAAGQLEAVEGIVQDAFAAHVLPALRRQPLMLTMAAAMDSDEAEEMMTIIALNALVPHEDHDEEV